mmetsp:Transcript_2999/g.8916  ORF Transcript_2999/g.8916 Transcript_2999/m.8916 type:complete len:396 (+) Transcript_2999:63-1250(+)
MIESGLLNWSSRRLVLVALLVHAGGGLGGLAIGLVLSELGSGVGAGTLDERLLGGSGVGILTLPRLEDRVLEGPGVRERHVPRVRGLVHGVQVEGSLELGLSSAEEHDARHGRRHPPVEHLQGVVGDLLRSGPPGALGTRGDHGRLEEDSLEHDTVVGHVLEGLGPGGRGNLKGAVDIVVSVEEDLRLDDRDKSSVLGDRGVAGQSVGAVADGDGGRSGRDGDDRPPLAEASSGLVVLGAPLSKSVETRAPGLSVGVGERVEALVDLDTRDDALGVQGIDHGLTRGHRVLEEGLLEQDGSRDVLSESRGGDEEIPVALPVDLGVLETDGFEPLAAGGVGLIHGKDSLSSGGNRVGGLDQLGVVGSGANHGGLAGGLGRGGLEEGGLGGLDSGNHL